MENRNLNIKSPSQQKSKEDMTSLDLIPPFPGMAEKFNYSDEEMTCNITFPMKNHEI